MSVIEIVFKFRHRPVSVFLWDAFFTEWIDFWQLVFPQSAMHLRVIIGFLDFLSVGCSD